MSHELPQQPAVEADQEVQPDQEQREEYPDLATYIRTHKVILCPKEELGEELEAAISGDELRRLSMEFETGQIAYIDEEGNIAGFKITSNDLENIGSLGQRVKELGDFDLVLDQELEKIGFRTNIDKMHGQGSSVDIYDVVKRYRAELGGQNETEGKE